MILEHHFMIPKVRWLKNLNLVGQILFLSCVFGIGLNQQSHAKSSPNTDPDYMLWKAKQQQHDERLKQHLNPSANTYQQGRRPQNQRAAQIQSAQSFNSSESSTQVLGEGVKININRANAQEIVAKLDGIGAKKAQEILNYRAQHGNFRQLNDLLNVKGIGIKTLDKNRERIRLTDQ